VVFASDAISSTAYDGRDPHRPAHQAQIAPRRGARWSPSPSSSPSCDVVVISYRQTIYAYPSGGGSYVVSRENLNEIPSLVAGRRC
jgi:hypothetical protein